MYVNFVEFQVQLGYPVFVSIWKAPHIYKIELHLLRFVVAANSSSSQCGCQRGLRCLYDIHIYQYFSGFEDQFGYPYLISICKPPHNCKSELHLQRFIVVPVILRVLTGNVKEI